MRAALLGTLLLLALAGAAQPRASLPDIEDEVMCMQCGTALNISTSPVADKQRDFIRKLIAEGKTKQEIKDALVAEFGPRVLALPNNDGFNLAVYVVPPLAVLLAFGAVVAILRRRRGSDPTAPEAGPELDASDSARLDRDLAAYDL
jgi:cytochrome c-type biogenesis protein CcmH